MKHPKKSDAKRRAWQPGGAHRIAHEQRLQAKKTAPVVDRTAAEEFRRLQQSATASPPHYPIPDIVTCMRISARMLEIADDHRAEIRRINSGQANLLRAAADALESQTAWSDQ